MFNHINPHLIPHRRHSNTNQLPPCMCSFQALFNQKRNTSGFDDDRNSSREVSSRCLAQSSEIRIRGVDSMRGTQCSGKLETVFKPVYGDYGLAALDA